MLRYLTKFLTPKITDKNRADALRSILGSCPICGGSLDGHEIAMLAFEVIPFSTDYKSELQELVERRAWHLVGNKGVWDPDADMRGYYVLRCSKQDHVQLIAVFTTAEIFSGDFVEEVRPLDQEDRSQVLEIVRDRWMRM